MQTLPPPDPPQQAIIVTARALPRPASERVLQREAIDLRELSNAPSRQLDRLIERFAGVQLFRRSDARSAHPTSQGVTLRALGGNAASRVQLVLDGVPQSDPFGGWVAWPAFAAGDLAEIQLTRGGGSVVHGPGALGGTITLTSADNAVVDVGIDAGSRGSAEGRASARGPIGAGFVAVSLQGGRGDGFIPTVASDRGDADRAAPYRNASGRFRALAPIGSQIELQAGISAFVDERERGLRYTASRSRGSDASLRLVSHANWAWTLLGYRQIRNFRSSFASIDAARSEGRRASLQYDVPGRSAGWSAEMRPPLGRGTELRIGADGRSMSGESRELASYSAGVAQRDRVAGGRSANAGLFAELSAGRGPILLSGAARIDRWSISDGRLTERSTTTGTILSDARFAVRRGWRPTARIAGAIDLSAPLTIRSAAYLGWRLPTLNELFRPFRAGADATAANPDLRPERLRGLEAGIDWKPSELSLSVTAFANRLEDAIANVTLGKGPALFPGVGFVAAGGAYRQRQNIKAIGVRGVEASAHLRRGPWSGRISSSMSNASVESDGSSALLDGLRPAQTPRFTAAASVGWEQDRHSASFVLRYEGSRFEDDLNRQRLPSALTFDAAAGYPLGKGLSLTARVENATNTRVAAAISGNGTVERSSPRTFWMGLAFSRDTTRRD